MLSKLEQLVQICAKLDKHGIVIHQQLCLHKRHHHSSCQRCSAVCPSGAIDCLGTTCANTEELILLAEKCTGCGACTSVCPSGALAAKLPSNQELHSLVALHSKNSGAVAFACETYLQAHPSLRPRVIAVQCLARCDESILVEAVLQGATTVSVLNVLCADCSQNKLCTLIQTITNTANRLLTAWKYPDIIVLTQEIPPKIKPLPITESEATGISRRFFLNALQRKSTSLFTQMLPAIISGTNDTKQKSNNELQAPRKEPKYLPDKWSSLLTSLKKLKSTTEPAAFASNIWGHISIANSCNGCEACVDICPTAALTICRQASSWSISLTTSRCTQCNLCQDICCCESIKITATVALDIMLAQTPQVCITKRQKDVDNLFEPLEQRMARLLGCIVKN